MPWLNDPRTPHFSRWCDEAPMTPPDSGEREPTLPCPHGRASWHHCPHCLGLNAPVPDVVITSDVNESAVVIGKSLAQRILAALDHLADARVDTNYTAASGNARSLAAELRAVIGK